MTVAIKDCHSDPITILLLEPCFHFIFIALVLQFHKLAISRDSDSLRLNDFHCATAAEASYVVLSTALFSC
jgi:hypothetical protein